jgi:hypothetical protein
VLLVLTGLHPPCVETTSRRVLTPSSSTSLMEGRVERWVPTIQVYNAPTESVRTDDAISFYPCKSFIHEKRFQLQSNSYKFGMKKTCVFYSFQSTWRICIHSCFLFLFFFSKANLYLGKESKHYFISHVFFVCNVSPFSSGCMYVHVYVVLYACMLV